jgi:flagellar biogenesis protein FliO
VEACKRICPFQYRLNRPINFKKEKKQGSKKMPRLAILLSWSIWGLLVGAATAQTSSRLQFPDDAGSIRAPAPPMRISDGDAWGDSNSPEPQAVTNREMPARLETQPTLLPTPSTRSSQGNGQSPEDDGDEPPQPPLTVPLPIPLLPPKLDESVKPVSFQENISEPSAEKFQQAEEDAVAAAEKTTAPAQDKTPLSPQNHKSKLPLAPSSKTGGNNSTKEFRGLPSMISIAGSTGVVLGIFLLLVWIVKRKTPQSMVRLPGEAFEILGRAPLNGKQQVQLLRCGSRLLLISVTPSGAETLTEITDPMEVDRLAGLCKQSQPGSSSAAFKQIFEQLAPHRPGRNENVPQGDDRYETATAGYYRSGRGWEDRDV